MDGAVDKRIVEMQFDNDQFEKGIKESIRSLEDLKKALELDKAAESLNNLDKAVSGSMKNIEESANSMASSLERMLDPIDTFVRNKLESIVSSIANAGERLVKAISIDAIHDGLAEYEELTKTTKTITNMVKGLDQFGGNEAAAFDAVTKQLNELNEYADKTIYGFNDMTTSYLKFVQNLGNTTSVEQATKDVEGLFNAAAYYGLNKTQAQMVSRNLAQAMGLGYMGMRDWWSFVNAGMASDDFKMRAIQAAIEVGSLDESGHIIDATGKAARKATVDLESFNETLQFKWFNKAVMERLFQQYSDGSTQLGRDAMEAATKVRTFKDMIDSLKEALGTGWASTFTLLFGDMYTIEKRLTAIKETFETIINYMTDKRNKAVSQWLDVGQYGHDPRNYVPGHYDVNMEDHTSGYVEAHYEDQENVDALTRSVENLGNALLNVFGLFDGISEAIGRGFKTGYADSMFKQWTDLFTVIGITPGNIEKASKGLLSMSESLYYALNATEEGEWARDSTFWDILHIAELIGSAFGFVVDAITPFAGLLDDVVLAITPLADVGLHIVAVLARMGTAILNQIREWGLFKKVAKVIEKLLLGIRIAFTIVADTIRAFVNWLFDGFYLGKFSDDIKVLWESLKNFGTKILDKLSALADKISKWYENAKQWIKDNEVLQKWKKSLTDFFTNLGNNIHAKIDQLFTNPSEFFKPLKEWFISFLASGLSLFGVENPEETAAKIVADIEGTVKKIKDGVMNTIAIIGSIFDPVEGSEDMSISEQLNERIHRLDELFEPIKTGLYGKLVDFLAWLGANDPLGKAEEIKTKVKAFVQSLSSIFDEIVRMLGEIGKPKHDQAQVMSSKTMIDELTGEEFELIGGVDGAATVIIDVAENSSESAEEMLARLQKVIEESQLSKNFTELQNLLLSGFRKVFDNFLNWLGLPHFEEITAKIEPELQKFGKQISDAVKLVYDSVFNFFHKPQQTITQAEGGGAYADVEYLSPFQSATANAYEAFGQIPKWFEDLKKAISDTVFKAFADFLAWLGTENPEQKATEIVESIRSTFGKVANVLGTIGSVISESITGAFKRRTVALGDGSDIIELGLAESIALNIQDATKSLPDILDGIGKGMTKILESILEAFGSSDPAADTQKVIDTINGIFEKVYNVFSTILGWIRKLFGGGGEKGVVEEVTEAAEEIDPEEVTKKVNGVGDTIGEILSTVWSKTFGISSAAADELDTGEIAKTAKETAKSSTFLESIMDGFTGFFQGISDFFADPEFNINKLLNVVGRGGFIIGGSAIALGLGSVLMNFGSLAKTSSNNSGIFSKGLFGMNKFTEFALAIWVAADAINKLKDISLGEIEQKVIGLGTIYAMFLAGDWFEAKVVNKDATAAQQNAKKANKNINLSLGGFLSFAAALSMAVGAISGLMALDLADNTEIADPTKADAITKALNNFFQIMGSLVLGTVAVEGVELTFSALMSKFGIASAQMGGFKDFCKAISSMVSAIAILTGINWIADADDVANAIQQFFEVFTSGSFLAALAAFLAHWSATSALGTGLKGFKDFATAVKDITEAVAMLVGLGLLDELDDALAGVDENGNVKKTNLLGRALIDLFAVIAELDIGAALGTFLQNLAVDKGGNKVDSTKAMKAMKTFGETIAIVVGAFAALVGIESVASVEAVQSALKHLGILMGLLVGADFLSSLGDAIAGTGVAPDWKKKLADFGAIALSLLAAVGSFWLLANIVESFDETTIDKAIEIMTPLSLMFGTIGSMLTVMDKLKVGPAAGLSGGVNFSSLFIIIYEALKFVAGLDSLLASLTGNEEAALKKQKDSLRTFGEMINSFFGGLLGVRDFTDPKQIHEFADSLTTFGNEMDGVPWEKVNPAVNSLYKFALIAEHLNNIGDATSLRTLISGMSYGLNSVATDMTSAQESLTKIGGLKVSDFTDLYTILGMFAHFTGDNVDQRIAVLANDFKSFTEDMKIAYNNVGAIEDVQSLYTVVDIFDKIARLGMDISSENGDWDKTKVKNMIECFNEFGSIAVDEGTFTNAGILASQFVKGFSDTASLDEGKVASDALTLIKMYTSSFDAAAVEGGQVYTSGANFTKGFADGIRNNASLATSAADAVGVLAIAALNTAIGSHSPSLEAQEQANALLEEYQKGITDLTTNPEILSSFQSNEGMMDWLTGQFGQYDSSLISIGAEWMDSIAKGEDAESDKPVNSGNNMATAVVTTVGNMAVEMYDVGVQFGIGFANGLASEASISAARNAGTVVGTVALNAARVAGAVASPSRKMFEIGEFFTMGFANGLLDRISDVEGNSKYLAGSAIDSMDSTLNTFSMLQAMGIDPTPTIRPVLDMSDIQAKASELNGLFGDFNTGRMSFGDFGFNTRGNGVSDLQADIRDMKDAIIGLQSHMSSLQIVLDSGALVGGISAGMDRQLGANYTRSRRGG